MSASDSPPPPTIVVNAPDVEVGARRVELDGPEDELGGAVLLVEDPPAYVSINPLTEVSRQS